MPETGRRRFSVSLPLRVLIVGGVLSALAALGWQRWLRAQTETRLTEDALELESRISTRMQSIFGLLRGASGLFATLPSVTRADFHRYVAELHLEHNYPGLQGVGFSQRLTPGRVDEVIAQARRDGRPNFALWPAGPRAEYHTIRFLEPEDPRNRAAFGYDMHSDPVRAAAMDEARDSGEAALSGRVTLVQEITAQRQAGFLIFFPFYGGTTDLPATAADRRARLAGFVYAPLRADDFVATIASERTLRRARLAIYDGPQPTAPNLLFDGGTSERDPIGGTVTRVRTLNIANRLWLLVYTMDVTGPVPAMAVFLFGVALSGGLGLLLNREFRARSRAERSEAVVREREDELALLIESVPVLVAFVDRAGVVRLANRRFRDWLAIDPARLIGRPLSEALSAELYPELAGHVARALNGDTLAHERWFNVPHARARYLASYYTPHRTPDGQLNGFYLVASDLTAHKRAEESARFVADCGKLSISSLDYEATARGVVHLAVPRVADVAVLFRVDGNELAAAAVAHVEPALEERLGEFLRGVRLSMGARHNVAAAARCGLVMIAPELKPEEFGRVAENDAQRAMLQALQLVSAMHVPVVVRGKPWGVFSLATTARSGRRFSNQERSLADEISTRVRLAVENAMLYLEAHLEVEERRRAETAARESEERFRLLVEGARDYALILLNPEGRITSWNEGAQRLFGFSAADAIGLPGSRLSGTDATAEKVFSERLALARAQDSTADERWYFRSDGTQFWASGHLVVLRDDRGGVRGYVKILRDLTERKMLEDELEQRVQQRTAELHDAVQELEAFSYSVSHDLRSPLRSIRGFTELTLEEAGARLTPSERHYLERVQRAVARLDRLITDLLAYTRISKARVVLGPVSLHTLITDIQREHPEFQLPLARVRIEGELLPVIGNEAYLTQCVTNLIGNAVKFMPPGRVPEVRVWTERRNSTVRLSVCDNGIGIPADSLYRVFEIFERLHVGGNYEGTGVGLAIVRRAVQRMKGTVGVESQENVGTTFWLELPAG